MKQNKTIAHLALLAANIFFGINNPVARFLMPDIINPLALSFLRFSGGMLLFWMASLLFKREHVPLKDIVLFFFASLFALTFNQLSFFIGLSKTSSIDASIVVTLLPIVTMILSAIFLKEPITKLKAIGVLVGASGALIIVFGGGSTEQIGSGNMLGNLIVFMASISFATYLTLFKKLIDRYHPITIMKWMFLFATITGIPFTYKHLTEINFETLTTISWMSIAYVIVFASFISYLLLPIGQKSLRPTTLSMYNYVQPIVASLIAVIIGLDKLGYHQILSALLVFSGVYIVTQSRARA